MKTVQINKIKVKEFEESDLREKLKMNDKDIEIILKYQRIFPELLQDDVGGFVIDGENLCKQLGIKDDFNNWLSRTTKGKEGKLIKYRCVENEDYINVWNFPNVKFTQEEIEKMNPQQRSRHGIKNRITLTLECAKKIAMRQNNLMGDLVCDYFITMEKTLRNYEDWVSIREPEKQNANLMKSKIKEWCVRNGYDNSDNSFYPREFNMLNMNLTGLTAQEIRINLGCKDISTREHLDAEINSGLDYLQKLNISLLDANMSFTDRSNIIKITCNNQYKHLFIAKQNSL